MLSLGLFKQNQACHLQRESAESGGALLDELRSPPLSLSTLHIVRFVSQGPHTGLGLQAVAQLALWQAQPLQLCTPYRKSKHNLPQYIQILSNDNADVWNCHKINNISVNLSMAKMAI